MEPARSAIMSAATGHEVGGAAARHMAMPTQFGPTRRHAARRGHSGEPVLRGAALCQSSFRVARGVDDDAAGAKRDRILQRGLDQRSRDA